MGQITSGVRAVLSLPYVYSSFQHLMGAHKFRINFVSEFVRPFSGTRILDIGCGPADILSHLPDVDYCGFDISEAYIQKARKTYGLRGQFQCKQLEVVDLKQLPMFDVVLAMGLLHHLDDALAVNVLQLAHKALKPGGRLLTVDPCLDQAQNPIARFLVRHDRGQNVRDKASYEVVAQSVFKAPQAFVRPQAWIPYTHCIMECQK
jgi:2-polyprenyl-3-methyl-5-hydroxy-6-metoxy-1,4-benzoquinol methylase